MIPELGPEDHVAGVGLGRKEEGGRAWAQAQSHTCGKSQEWSVELEFSVWLGER